jgi:hypothetical protein
LQVFDQGWGSTPGADGGQVIFQTLDSGLHFGLGFLDSFLNHGIPPLEVMMVLANYSSLTEGNFAKRCLSIPQFDKKCHTIDLKGAFQFPGEELAN